MSLTAAPLKNWPIEGVVDVEEHCGLGGNIISSLDNGAFEGLI